jgi:hypothetical protein
MMKNMLGVIEDIFLKQRVKVILVSHSPTTLALAPEDAIFVMNPSGESRIEKKSKQEALSILTQGFATIEQGLKLFDEITKSSLTIISEGNNVKLISKSLELHGINGVEVLTGVEGTSGKNQLRALFDFLSRTNHTNKVIFVWDCDASMALSLTNNTFPYVLEKNNNNGIAKKGIENIFPTPLFERFKKTINLSDGTVITEFDESRKKDFCDFIVGRNNLDDFKNFAPLIAEIKRIKTL